MDIKRKSYSDRKKRVQWTPEAVRFLLQLWKQMLPEIQKTKRTGPIYTKMSLHLIKHGFNFSAREVNVKLHNLTNKYKDESRQVKCGTVFESEWRLYKPLDYLLGRQRGRNWKSLMAESSDPLHELNDDTLHNDEDARAEGKQLKYNRDAILKIEYEENELQSDSYAAETNQPSNCSSSDVEVNDEKSEIDILLNSETSTSKKKSEINPKVNDNSNFRIIADRILTDAKTLKSKKDIPTRNGIWPAVNPKKVSKQSETGKPSVQSLNMARWELIQLQKAKAKQEIEYRRQEFEQKTREHKLRLRYMEEEHELRMMSLRKDLSVTPNYLEESD